MIKMILWDHLVQAFLFLIIIWLITCICIFKKSLDYTRHFYTHKVPKINIGNMHADPCDYLEQSIGIFIVFAALTGLLELAIFIFLLI